VNSLMSIVASAIVDRPKLVKAVEKVADVNSVYIVDCWDYIKNNANTPTWMRVIAREEVERHLSSNRDFMGMLNAAFTKHMEEHADEQV